MFSRLLLHTLLVLVLALTAPPAGAAPVSLRVPSRTLCPASTLEVRFAEPMVAGDLVGTEAEQAPVEIVPAVPHTFTWLDARGGVVRPTAPLPLGTTFEIRLRPGLTTLAGSALPPEWSEKVATPPMELRSGAPLHYYNPASAPVLPEVSLLFNVNVAPERAAKYLKFVSSAGAEMPAEASQNEKDYAWRHRDPSGRYFTEARMRELAPWEDQFRLASGDGEELSLPPRNQLTVRPSRPLPPGEGWKLQIADGLPALNAGVRLLRASSVDIGTVRPFTVLAAEAENFVGSGKRVVIRLSRSVARDVTPQNIVRWVMLQPTPPGMQTAVHGDRLVFTGDFLIGEPVKVTIDPGLPCAEPMLLAHRFEQALTFEPIAPRLYFEEFETHQLSTGRREFQLLTVNVPRVKVKAKLFAGDTATRALKAWQDYYQHRNGRWDADEPYQRIAAEDLPGVDIFEREYAVEQGLDETKMLRLSWDEILGAGNTGVVLLTAERADELPAGDTRPGTQAIVQVTDIGLVWKTSEQEHFLYAFSLATGKALAGVQLTQMTEAGAAATVATDEQGIARFSEGTNAKWVLARHDADLHLVPFEDRNEISLYRFRLDLEGARYTEELSDDADWAQRKAFLFTDRGVYRPGDKVHLKGILRDFSSGASAVPSDARLTVVITDPRSRRISVQDVTLSAMGSFDATVALSPLGATGRYEVALRQMNAEGAGDEWASHEFQVQEYTPNAFEVNVRGEESFLGTTSVELPIAAQYYMGNPLASARLKWTVRATDAGFQPAGFDDFVFCDALDNYRLRRALDRVSEFSEQGQADLSSEGKAAVVSTVPVNRKAPQPREGRLLCEVTDLNQQTVSAEHGFTVHSSDFYLGLSKFPNVVREGEVVPLRLVAVNRNGDLRQEAVSAIMRISRVDWQINRVEGAGRAAAYHSEPILTLAQEEQVQTSAATREGRKWSVAPDAAGATFTGAPGQYLVEATARDSAGRDVVTSTTVYVFGAGETVWNYRNPFQIELVPDRESYRAGDTARLLVKTPIAGQALVTVERENVRRAFVAELSGNAPAVEIPITGEDAPNIYVSVMLLRGADGSTRKWKMPEYRVGYTKLAVERPEAKLTVYVRPGQSSYRPGDEATLTAEVLDHESNPVPHSEVTLYAVDEGVLSLTGYETPRPLAFFQQQRALRVSTGLTLPQLLGEDPDEAQFSNKGYLIGDGGGPDRVRKNFLACAFWSSALQTDDEGRVTATFTVPDGLTRYRVIAVAQTARDQFGSADSAFEVNKFVMIEPAPPRFGNVGDKLLLRAVVHNTTAAAGEARVTVELDETAVGEVLERTVALSAHGSAALDFPVEFREEGEAKWTWSVNFTGDDAVRHRDAAVTTLQVHYPAPARRQVHFQRVNGGIADLLTGVPPELMEGRGSVRVSVTNSRALELREALESLLGYPYGCVEQTTSSTLPWITLRSFTGVLPELQRPESEIAAMVERGVNRLLSMQTSSGGLSYWPGAREPGMWYSAYGGLGLALAKKAGHEVPEDAFARLCAYLSQGLRGMEQQHEQSSHAMALYTLALAGKAEPSYHEVLFRRRHQLSQEDRALLALAIAESGAGTSPMITDLLALRTSDNASGQWFGSASRATSMQLLAWCETQPAAPIVEELARSLGGHRTARGWSTTQGNAWALLALGRYVEKVEGQRAAADGMISWGGQQKGFALPPSAALAEQSWKLDEARANEPLRIKGPAGQTLFTEVTIESRPKLVDQPRQDSGFTVSRSYQRIADDGTVEELRDARVGDRILVTLEFTVPVAKEYLAIEDPLPSVFEPLHPEFKTQQTVGEEHATASWYSDFHELRTDRALFFRNAVPPGSYRIRYLARVCAAGSAIAPSAKVEEMYAPENFGLSGTTRLTALPWN